MRSIWKSLTLPCLLSSLVPNAITESHADTCYTDDTKYLAEHAKCFGMMDAIVSHLSEIGAKDWFVKIKVIVKNSRATMIYDDGNGKEHARQEIPYTDFPLEKTCLYACWDGSH